MIPDTESLKDTYERVVPYYKKNILPLINKNIIIAAHGNSIRSLCKHIFEIDDIFAKDYYLETKGRICGSSDSPELESPPTAVMKDIIETELNQNINVHPSYLEVDSNLSYGNWSIAFSQTEQIEAKKIIQEIAKM